MLALQFKNKNKSNQTKPNQKEINALPVVSILGVEEDQEAPKEKKIESNKKLSIGKTRLRCDGHLFERGFRLDWIRTLEEEAEEYEIIVKKNKKKKHKIS